MENLSPKVPQQPHPTLLRMAARIGRLQAQHYCPGADCTFVSELNDQGLFIWATWPATPLRGKQLALTVKPVQGRFWVEIVVDRETVDKAEMEAIRNAYDDLKTCAVADWLDASATIPTPLLNLTPHPIRILDEDGQVIGEIPVSGWPVPRVDKDEEIVAFVHAYGMEIPLKKVTYGRVQNMPDPIPGVSLIVSVIVKQALPHRTDLLTVEDVIRHQKTGEVLGCRSLGI